MLSDYIQAAMRHARYDILPEDGTFYGEIPECPGVWANAVTLEECRRELQEVLEDWLVVGFRRGHTLPVIDGINLNVQDKDVA